MLDKFDHGGDIYSQQVSLDFSVNINPLGMPTAVRDAIINAVDSYKNYPDPKCRKLCAALAERLGCSGDWLLCGNGAADLIIRLCLSIKPEHVLVCAPTFSEYEKAALMAGAKVKKYVLSEDCGYCPDASILDSLPGADIFFLCNPNNPTGVLAPPELIRKIADRCEAQGTVFMIDECFLEFTNAPTSMPLLADHPHMIILRAFTKIYSVPGLRLGYAVSANPNLLSGISYFGQSWNVSGPAQAAGLAALELEPEWTERTCAFIAEENAYVRGKLRGLGLKVWDGAANYTLFRAPKYLGSRLMEHHILVRSCSNYTGLSDEHWRFGIKQREQNEILISRIREVLTSEN